MLAITAAGSVAKTVSSANEQHARRGIAAVSDGHHKRLVARRELDRRTALGYPAERLENRVIECKDRLAAISRELPDVEAIGVAETSPAGAVRAAVARSRLNAAGEAPQTCSIGRLSLLLGRVPSRIEVGKPRVETMREVVVGEVPDVAKRWEHLLGAAGVRASPAPRHQLVPRPLGTSAPTIRTSGASAGVWSAMSPEICREIRSMS